MRLLALLFLALAPQDDGPDDPLERAPAEGPLDNDVFVEVSGSAARALVAGDAELVAARSARDRGDGVERERRLGRAFEAWREALVDGGPGALVWYDPARQDPGRVAEGVAAVVDRRLFELTPDERSAWSAHWNAVADIDLAAADTDEDALAEVVRRNPLTAAAGRAGLRLADLALESGRTARARAWLGRAALDLEAGGAAGARTAAAAREALLPTLPSPRPEVWQVATAFEVTGRIDWRDPVRRRPRPAGADRMPRAGGAFVGDDELVVQTADELLTVALAGPDGPRITDRRRLADLLEGNGGFLEHDEPGPWPLLPLWTGDRLALVVGRSRLEPNALVVLERPPADSLSGVGLDLRSDLGLGPPRAGFRLAWAVIDDERLEPGGATARIAGLEGLETLEFQPGPVYSGDLVVVQAREYVNQIRDWLLAFDLRDGSLVWRRLVAAGADRLPTERFTLAAPRFASQPLLDLADDGEALVFAGTHLGAGALVETRTGEFRWLFKNRRRPPRAPGWTGDRPVLGTSSAPATTPVILWAPWDSDHMYPLRPGVPPAGQDEDRVLQRGVPAVPMVEAEALLGGDVEEAIVLARDGKERTISARRAGLDRVDALDLGPDEAFSGRGLVGPARVWVPSDRGVYLFDRTRELYLLDFQTLTSAAAGAAAGGDLVARGARVVVVGSGGLWVLAAR